MDPGQCNRGNKHGKEVMLEMKATETDRKGWALVGRLETDKSLNRGIVVSMIRKGWGIDKDLEIHDMPEKKAFLFRFVKVEDFNRVLRGRPRSIQGSLLNIQYWDELMVYNEVDFSWCPYWAQFHGLPHIAFDHENVVKLGSAVGKVVMFEAPKLNGRLTRITFIRTKVLINITQPLTTGFWVPRPNRDPTWVRVRYERLQNYCYDCGRIGHDGKNYRFQSDELCEDDEEEEYGSWLGTPHVKTIEEAIEICKNDWDKVNLLRENSSPANGNRRNGRDGGGSSGKGKIKVQGEKSGFSISHRITMGNGQKSGKGVINERKSGGIIINELSNHGDPNSDIQKQQQPSPHVNEFELGLKEPNTKVQPEVMELETPKGVSNNNESPKYRVDFPVEDEEAQSAIVPFIGLSPLSAITDGLNRIKIR